jgi:hypothetical protein
MNARIFSLAAIALLFAGSALAEDIPESLAKKLAEFKGAENGQVAQIADEAVAGVFPGRFFYTLRFRRYPIARRLPEPLGSNNLFVVKPDGSVEYLRDRQTLENFFRAALPPVKTDTAAKDAARAWLGLAQEFYQDGFFQFSIAADSVKVTPSGSGLEVAAKAVVNQRGGDTGEIVAALTFDRTGKLLKVSQSGQVRAGVRPICQATKLLDPEPIVRGMAEQAILVMGRAAKTYLDEQRAKAGPELQRAIDRIWQRIVAEGR